MKLILLFFFTLNKNLIFYNIIFSLHIQFKFASKNTNDTNDTICYDNYINLFFDIF